MIFILVSLIFLLVVAKVECQGAPKILYNTGIHYARIIVPTCGPMNVFPVSVSGDGSTSTLSTHSVDDTVNGTRVLCGDEDVNETVCVACEKRLWSLIYGYSYMHFAL